MQKFYKKQDVSDHEETVEDVQIHYKQPIETNYDDEYDEYVFLCVWD